MSKEDRIKMYSDLVAKDEVDHRMMETAMNGNNLVRKL